MCVRMRVTAAVCVCVTVSVCMCVRGGLLARGENVGVGVVAQKSGDLGKLALAHALCVCARVRLIKLVKVLCCSTRVVC